MNNAAAGELWNMMNRLNVTMDMLLEVTRESNQLTIEQNTLMVMQNDIKREEQTNDPAK